MTAISPAENAVGNGLPRVLIVDDDRDQAEGLADLLESRDYRSAVAHNVAAARRVLAEFSPQVALIDLRLGGESGMDLVRELRESRPDLLCVIVTAHADLDNTVQSVQYRVFDFLRKPLGPATLFSCLDRCAEQIMLREQGRRAEEALRRSTEQIERFNRLAVGREQRILELKREVNELCRTLDWGERFDSAALAEDESAMASAEESVELEASDDASLAGVDLASVIDLQRVQGILDSFCDAAGVAAAIVDLDGKVLIRSRWQSICTDFHRVHDRTCRGCVESDTALAGQLGEGRQYAIYQCRNGLTDAASPIVIGDRHVANAFVGQFLVKPPDVAFFRRQAAHYGFDEHDYLAAIRKVPIVPPSRLPVLLGFVTGLAAFLANMGLERMHQEATEKTLKAKNRELQSQRQAAVSLAEDAQLARLAAEQAGEALRRERDFSRTLVETSPTFFVTIDPDGKTVMMNEVMLATLGYRQEEIVGKDYLETFVPEADHPTLAELFARLTRDKQATVNENRVLTRDGREFPVEWHGSPILDAQGNVEYFFGVGIDITERKRAEREREALIQKLEAQNAELERFAYSVSHDLKSPLITIQGFLGILREDLAKQDEEAIGHDLARIGNAAVRMAKLLGDVLELSRIGRLVNPSEHISLADLAREAVNLVEGRINDRRVDICIAPELPVVFGDRSRLLDVLQNLIDNAVKYMGDQPQPRVEIGCRDDRGVTVCFVRDNGMGIEPRYFESIFGLFEQLNPEMEGTGVGLALVKRIIELHSGRIWIESDGPGRGSVFFFTLPPRAAEDAQ